MKVNPPGHIMSNIQNLVLSPTQTGSFNQCLTGCMYQVVQNPGVQGKNVLQLIPLVNAKDTPVPVVSPPANPKTPVLNVRMSMPSAPSNVTLPVNAQLIQQLGSKNYIITTQNNPADASKTIRVDNKHVVHPNTTILLEKPQLSLPSSSQTGAPSFILMNTKPTSIHGKPIPFPPGHGLQIPAHAEVKSLPASALPLSVQQRILPPTTSIDTTKNPSVIYVSPVNTVKTPPACSKPNILKSVTKPSPLTPILIPVIKSNTLPSVGPFKWVVQENTESKACIVPVKSTSDTASKIITLMSGVQTEALNLPTSTNVTNIKDNALVMCNNKIYFLAKQGIELGSAVHIKQESSDKASVQAEQSKDLANKVVEVVLSKHSLSSPNSKQTLNSGSPALVSPDEGSLAVSKPSTPPQARKNIPEVIYIDDDDDEDIAVSTQKPQDISPHPKNTVSSAKVYDPPASLGCDPHGTDKQVKDKEPEMSKVTKAPIPLVIDDQTLRAKFGLLKQEKIILGRIPLLRPESKSDPSTSTKDMVVYNESQEKRKAALPETSYHAKRRKSADVSDFTGTEDLAGDYPRSSSTTTVPLFAGSFDMRDTTSGEKAFSSLALNETKSNEGYGTSRSAQNSGPEMYTEPSDCDSFYAGQDITGHFSEASLPRQRFHIEPSVYPDETTKDEKIQHLKEVLKEREQALEALRRQKWS